MNLSRRPLRINAGFLLNAQIGYSRDIHFDFPHIKLEGDLELSQFKGRARVNRTSQGILVQCQFAGNCGAECVRCLEPISYPIQCDFSELFAFNHRSTTESNLILRDDGNIDLEPLAREYLLLEVPISPLCRPDCKGLCATCGEDLNVTTCEHAVQTKT